MARSGANVPTKCSRFIPLNVESWNQSDDAVIAKKTAAKTLKPNNK